MKHDRTCLSISLLVNDPTVQLLTKTGKKVGIDASITSLITISDGEAEGKIIIYY